MPPQPQIGIPSVKVDPPPSPPPIEKHKGSSPPPPPHPLWVFWGWEGRSLISEPWGLFLVGGYRGVMGVMGVQGGHGGAPSTRPLGFLGGGHNSGSEPWAGGGGVQFSLSPGLEGGLGGRSLIFDLGGGAQGLGGSAGWSPSLG